MSDKLQKIIDELSTLTVVEAAELSSKLEEHWGVSASVASAPASGDADDGASDEVTVTLLDFGESKINVIKEIRNILGLGLGDAKAFVESAPKVVKEGIKKDDAQEIKSALEAAGGKVEVK
ncbi:MAG: 50S ribosomal protein L7/L12 [Alphaproteobacteria bacterium]|nr:50S ribosomal protein L7/L12 [Alphaproteobacteria bacterium]MBL0717785.1 50S ribosomal protein L7/L12 [Alphaproteobacteria bacterium]